MAGDRLTALDSSFLHLEDATSHMHVATTPPVRVTRASSRTASGASLRKTTTSWASEPVVCTELANARSASAVGKIVSAT